MRKTRAILIILLTISLIVPAIPQVQADFDTWQIDLGTDDCFKYPGVIDTGGINAPYWLHMAIVMESGLRWTNIDISQGSTIDSAYLRWVCKFSKPQSSQPIATIKGGDEDNCSTFSTAADFDIRPRTDASVAYVIPAVTINIPYDTPDLKTIIQEIIDRPGWESGNAISLLIGPNPTGDQAVWGYSFEGDPNKACILMITWTPPPPEKPTNLFGAGFNSSGPYVELHWDWNYTYLDFFEVQNSSNAVTWTYLGQSTTANYTDTQVVNGTERHYRVRACNQTDAVWYNSSFSDVNFETVYFIEAVGGTIYQDVNVTGAWVDYNFTSIITKIGNNTGGNTLNNTYWKEPGMFYSYNVTEVSGAPGLNVEFNITGLPDNLLCLSLRNFLAYDGNVGHTFEVQAYNYTSSSWIFIADIPDECCIWINGTLGCLPGDFTQGGLFMGRYYHSSPGNTNHEFSLNYGKLGAYAPYEEECPPVDGAPAVDDYSIIFLAMGLIFCLAIYFLYTRNK